MEGGERKRKASTLEPNLDELPPAGDEQPQSTVVAAVQDDVEESDAEKQLLATSSTDLSNQIGRAKQMLRTLALKDGGVKMRARLKRLEVEFERKKLIEEEKCKKTSLLAEESTSTGAIEGSLCRTQSSAPQSAFGLHFCSNLDDKRAIGRAKPVGGKPSKECDNNKTGMKENHSESIDAPLQSNGAELPNQSSPELHPDPGDNDAPRTSATKAPAPSTRPLRRSRRKNKPILLLVEADLEDDAKDEAEKVDHSSKEKMIYYPARDNFEAIEIFYSHLECLAPLTYLSSTIMNFYIWYLQKPTSPTAKRACKYHFFNTYFYNVLKRGGLDKLDKESFGKFRKWWKGVHLFEKAYIFLPIHDHFHWSLVIICIPDREVESGPIILHLDSLGLHKSKPICDHVKSFLIAEWKFLKGVPSLCEVPLADKVWEKLSRRIYDKKVEVPRQDNEYDCGLFVLYFIERFILDAPKRMNKKQELEMFGKDWFEPKEASDLRGRIKDILTEELENSDHYACKRDGLTTIVHEASSLEDNL